VAALDLASNHWPLGSVLGDFFHKFAKWIVHLFIFHVNQLQWRTVKVEEWTKEHL